MSIVHTQFFNWKSFFFSFFPFFNALFAFAIYFNSFFLCLSILIFILFFCCHSIHNIMDIGGLRVRQLWTAKIFMIFLNNKIKSSNLFRALSTPWSSTQQLSVVHILFCPFCDSQFMGFCTIEDGREKWYRTWIYYLFFCFSFFCAQPHGEWCALFETVNCML